MSVRRSLGYVNMSHPTGPQVTTIGQSESVLDTAVNQSESGLDTTVSQSDSMFLCGLSSAVMFTQ